MSKLQVDVAKMPVVKGELTTVHGTRGTVLPPTDNKFAQRAFIAAGIFTLLWLAACTAYIVLISRDAGTLASLPLDQVVIYMMAAILPVLAVWLVAFNMMQARDLRGATALMNNTLLAMTYPSDAAQGRVAKAVESLSVQAAELAEATENARNQTDTMEALFRKQTELLRTASEIAEDRATRIQSMLGRRSEELSSVTQTLSDRAEVMQTTISAGTQQIASASAEATERTRIAHNILSNRAEGLVEAAEKAAARTEGIGDLYQSVIRDLDDATTSAMSQFEHVSAGYQGQIETMIGATDDLAGRTKVISELMKREVDVLETAGEKTRERAERIEKSITSHAENMNLIVEDSHKWVSQTADYFAAQAIFMKDTASDAVKTVSGHVETAVGRVDDASRDFLTRTASLGAKAGEVADRMGQASLRLQHSAEEVSSAWQAAADAALEQVQHSTETFQTRSEDMQRIATVAAKSISDAAKDSREQVRLEADTIATVAGETASRTEELRNTLRQASSELAATSAGATEHLRAAGDDLDRKREHLSTAAEDAMAKAQELGTVFDAESQRLSASAQRAGGDVGELRETIESASVVLRSLAQDIVEKSRGLERSLSQQSDIVSRTTRQAADDAKQIEQIFGASAEGLATAAARTQERMRDTSRDVLDQVKRLQAASQDGVTSIHLASTSLQEGAAAIDEHGKTAARRLKKLAESLEEHDSHARVTSDRATERLMSVSEILEIVSHKLTEMAEEAVSNMHRSTDALSEKAEGVAERAHTATASMAEAGHKLEQQAVKLSAHARDTMRNLETVGSGFNETQRTLSDGTDAFRAQADMLTDSAREIIVAAKAVSTHADKADRTYKVRADELVARAEGLASRLDALEALEHDTTQGAFLKAANNVMESLGSLAIDIDRMMETDIPDQTWKQYQAGDTSAFAKRLLKVAGTDSRGKIADRFRNDQGFRENVVRYVKQFEGILGKAMENERTDALAGTLLSSNMGKLYVLLAQSINRLH